MPAPPTADTQGDPPARFATIGAGNMGGSILRGSVERGGLEPRDWAAADPSEPARVALSARGVRTASDAAKLGPLIANDAIIVLAVKPQMLQDVAPALASVLTGSKRCVLSILAGTPVASIIKSLGVVRNWQGGVLRAMPSTPVSIGKGLSALAAAQGPAGERLPEARALLTPLGPVFDLEESMIDAFTAIAGSGPAYVFAFTEALAKAAESLGFDEQQAMHLAAGTVIGAAGLLEQNAGEYAPAPPDAAALRRAVTSKGGTTAAALDTFSQGGLDDLVRTAAASAARRASELAESS